jgi:dienelactone hydrolase
MGLSITEFWGRRKVPVKELVYYPQAKHGWCIADTVQYNELKTEEVWNQLLSFLEDVQ